MTDPIVELRGAVVEFPVRGGTVRPLDGVDVQLQPGQTLGVVGESGCGKTTMARVILGLQPLAHGEVLVQGRPIRGVPPRMAATAGMVWQDPYASLDPRWTIGRSVAEPLRLLGRQDDIAPLLAQVGLDRTLAWRYPHQLSGGQRQRAAIARAIALRPPVVICDEPTAALDLSIQAQILNLLRDLQASANSTFLYISHDLHTVRFLADAVAVMYFGRIVEIGPVQRVFESPRHPYTRSLLDVAPTVARIGHLPGGPQGEIPDPRNREPGCAFAPRCPRVQDLCRREDPPLEGGDEGAARCFFPLGVERVNSP